MLDRSIRRGLAYFFNCILRDVLVDGHLAALSDSDSSADRLFFDEGIPLWLDDVDVVGNRQSQAAATILSIRIARSSAMLKLHLRLTLRLQLRLTRGGRYGTSPRRTAGGLTSGLGKLSARPFSDS